MQVFLSCLLKIILWHVPRVGKTWSGGIAAWLRWFPFLLEFLIYIKPTMSHKILPTYLGKLYLGCFNANASNISRQDGKKINEVVNFHSLISIQVCILFFWLWLGVDSLQWLWRNIRGQFSYCCTQVHKLQVLQHKADTRRLSYLLFKDCRDG